MKFSVIVCAYNEENVISKCLDSIKSVNFRIDSFEIIVVNDGSTDNTEKNVLEFISNNKDINITYINIEHAGLSVARNAGIKHSTHDYVVFIDADALIDSELLSQYEITYKNSNVDFSGGRINLLNKNSSIAHFFQKTRFKQIFDSKRYKEQLIGANMSFKKDLFFEDGGFPDIFISRGDDTFIKNKFMKNYIYSPTPDAIVYHERPTSFIDCIKIFYIESINGEKLKKIISAPSYFNNILIVAMSLLFFIIAGNIFLSYPAIALTLFILYVLKSIVNSFLVIRYDNKENIIIYSLGYSLLKVIERVIKTYVYYIRIFDKTPTYSRSLNNFSIKKLDRNEAV